MTESEKKRVINKTVAIVKNVLSNPFVIGFDMSGEPYIDRRVVTKQIRKALEDKL